jgi:glyoxylase-like metal-dependent hydrolase (beta-lactamase superfamily II)
MCEPALNHPFTGTHVCEMVRNVFSGRVVFHDGRAEVAPGVEVVCIGGHSRGLQAVRVRTAGGWIVLASDASHFYENFAARKLFPIYADAEPMLAGFHRLTELADTPDRIIPGHDPLVRRMFPQVAGGETGAAVHRLDVAPDAALTPMLRRLAGSQA